MPVTFWGNSKPPPGTPIDYSHPLADGLVLAFPFNQMHGQPIDNVHGLVLKPKGQLQDTLRWIQGAGFVNAPSGNGAEVTAPGYTQLAMPVTLVWQGLKLGAAGAASAGIFGVSGDSATVTGGCWLGWVSTTVPGVFGGNGATALNGSGTPADGKLWMAATLVSGRQALYVNNPARPNATAAGTTQPTYTAASTVFVGSWGATARASNHRCDLAYLWNRELQVSDLEWLYAEPYTMFAPPVWRRYFVPAAVAGKSLVMPSPTWRRKTRYRVLR